jgi:hypothetical protein
MFVVHATAEALQAEQRKRERERRQRALAEERKLRELKREAQEAAGCTLQQCIVKHIALLTVCTVLPA